ncbi:MAG: hypothetical protein LKF53_02680 [Solobacterium sp.]|nr:hypothetical protein [Solobacterium sp.]
MEDWLKRFFTTGVFTGNFEVTAAGGMQVSVSAGYSDIDGKVAVSDDATILGISAASGTIDRIDSVMLRRDDTNRMCKLIVAEGSSSSQPVPPDIVRSNGIYDLRLANISVKAGAIKINQQDITDTRSSADCGIVTATVKEMDFSQFAKQFADYFSSFKNDTAADITTWFSGEKTVLTAWKDNREKDYETWYSERQSAFDKWFAEVVGKMSEDVAAKLVETTTELDTRLSLMESMVLNNDMSVPITDDVGNLIVDDDGNAILAEWKYKTE